MADLPEVPGDLRLGRRTLEELSGVAVVTDWIPEGTGLWRLAVDLTPADLGTAFAVPRTSRWYVRAPDKYPRGKIDILPAAKGGIAGIFPHQRPLDVPSGVPYRGAKICVATDSEGNLRRDDQAEPRSAEDRLAWHIQRTIGWIECASKGTLLSPGDPFELPVYRGDGAGLFAFREGPKDFARWSSIAETVGLADLWRFDVDGGHVWVVAAFRSLGGDLLFQPPWGTGATSRDSHRRVALWMRVPDVVMRPPYAAPSTWRELSDALSEQGVVLSEELARGTAGLHDGARHPLLIGFPVPQLVGGPHHQMNWLAVDLPGLELRAPHGFRPNEVGLWMASSRGTFNRDAKVPWATSQNWHPDELATRGRLRPDLTQTRVLLIGAGSLGSAVAELVVRAGAISMTVLDGQALEMGNLVRHTLTMDQLGLPKADALARRLNAASPSVVVTARVATAEDLLDAKFLRDFDLVIETTGDHLVLELLGSVKAPHLITYASLAVHMHARHLIAHLSRGIRFPVDEFDAAYAPFARAERDRGEERPMEGIGCWHPVFPARADQVWMMASAAVGLLNDSWPVAEGTASLHVFERMVDEHGNFASITKVGP